MQPFASKSIPKILKTLSVCPKSLSFEPGQQRLVVVELAPLERGLLTGTIVFSYRDEAVLEVPVVLNVRSENFLFDTTLSLSDYDRQFSPGQQLFTQIDLKEVGQHDPIDVTATYYIKDYAGRIHLQESETFFVLNEKTYTKTFTTRGLPAGKYILGLELVYPGAFATSSVQFEVKEPFTLAQSSSALAIALIAFGGVIVLVVLFFTILRRPTMHHRRR